MEYSTGLFCAVLLACASQLLAQQYGKCEDMENYASAFRTCYKTITTKDYTDEDFSKLAMDDKETADKIYECDMLANKMLNEEKTVADVDGIAKFVRQFAKDAALQDSLEAGVKQCNEQADLKMKIRCMYEGVQKMCMA